MTEPEAGGGRASRTDYTVLGCLSLAPMSGYDIKKLIDGSIGHFWSESYGQIYPSLRRLAAEGLIEEREGEGEGEESGRRGRRTYAVTAAGLRELGAWLVRPAQPDVVRYETSLKLFFGALAGPEAARDHLLRYRERQAALEREYREATLRLARERAGSAHLPYWLAVVDGGVRYARMAIEWCDATLARLEEVPRIEAE